MQVAEILKAKGTHVFTARPETPLADILRTMWLERVGCVVITDASERLVGMISERVIVHGLAASGHKLLEMRAGDRMETEVETCTPETWIEDVMKRMTMRRVRHMPVVEGDALLGIVSLGDVVKNRLGELEAETSTLRGYLHAIR
ncbi:MAG: CBS domain-containing protein [Alphaproteobacteria bacterium]